MNLPNAAAEGSLVSIVDDDPSFGTSLRRLITTFGLKSDVFLSAQAFLDSGRVEDTVCLLLDLRMPGMDGLALQRRLRETDRLIPIIFVTEHAGPDERRQAMQAGALHILRKPVNARALIETVLEAVVRPHRYGSAGRTQDALISTSLNQSHL